MDEPPAPTPAPTPTASEPVPDAGSGSAAPAAPPAPGSRPLSINDRALTIGKGHFDVHGALPIVVLPFLDAMLNKSTQTFVGFAFGGTYGIDDKTEIGADYGIGLSPGDIAGPLVLHAGYSVKASAKFDAALGGAFIIDPVDTADPTTMMTTTTTYVALQLGAWVRYRITPKVSLFSGLPSLPHPDVSLSKQGIAFPPMPYQLTLGFNSGGAIALGLPVGVGGQVKPNIYLFAATNLANIKISNTSNAFLFKDFIPLTLGGFYSLQQLDIGAEFSDDLKQAGDYLAFTILVRYFVK